MTTFLYIIAFLILATMLYIPIFIPNLITSFIIVVLLAYISQKISTFVNNTKEQEKFLLDEVNNLRTKIDELTKIIENSNLIAEKDNE